MRNSGLEEAQASSGIKLVGRSINNLIYADVNLDPRNPAGSGAINR